MCKEALKLLPAGAKESKTFMLCDEKVKLVKDDKGMIFAHVGNKPPLKVLKFPTSITRDILCSQRLDLTKISSLDKSAILCRSHQILHV